MCAWDDLLWTRNTPAMSKPATHRINLYVLVVVGILLFLAGCHSSPDRDADWKIVNVNSTGNKYSSLKQIDTANVQQLQMAWIHRTGDMDTAAHSQIQCNPVIVNGVLYGV